TKPSPLQGRGLGEGAVSVFAVLLDQISTAIASACGRGIPAASRRLAASSGLYLLIGPALPRLRRRRIERCIGNGGNITADRCGTSHERGRATVVFRLRRHRFQPYR